MKTETKIIFDYLSQEKYFDLLDVAIITIATERYGFEAKSISFSRINTDKSMTLSILETQEQFSDLLKNREGLDICLVPTQRGGLMYDKVLQYSAIVFKIDRYKNITCVKDRLGFSTVKFEDYYNKIKVAWELSL